MQLVYTPYILPLILALLIAIYLFARVWKYRRKPIASTFLILVVAIALWSTTAAIEHVSIELSAKIFWLKATYFGITVIPIAWLAFALQYTNREKWLTQRNLALLLIIPLATLVMVWTNDLHYLMWKDIWLDTSISPPVDAVTHNVWFWIFSAYSYALLVIGTLLIFIFFRHSSGIYRKQAGLMLLAALVPWAGNFLFIAPVEIFSVIDPTPLSLAITGVALFFALSRFYLLDVVPVAMEAIFESMVDGVIILDTENRIVDINPAALKIIKQAKTEVIGQLYNQVLPEWANVLVPKSKMDKEEAHIAIDEINEQRYYALYFSPIFKRQRLTGHLIHIHDDTRRIQAENDARERIRLEAELAERKRMHTIEAEAEAAKLANKAKSEFLASMSHELRTPLNAGIGFAQVLREQDFGPLNDKQVEYLNDIITSGKHLLSLINDILDLSKIEAGKEEMKLSDINIKELLQGSLVMIKEKAATHKISLSLQVAPEMESLQIKADERKVKQIMFNLLSNAAKFTPDGGAITVEGKQDKGEIVISVTDTGIGIKPADKNKLFQPFSQLQSGITGKTPGTGLGLVISKNLVELHGGRIWVASEGEGKGSQFSFTVPIRYYDN